jgi:hypothetical protein
MLAASSYREEKHRLLQVEFQDHYHLRLEAWLCHIRWVRGRASNDWLGEHQPSDGG